MQAFYRYKIDYVGTWTNDDCSSLDSRPVLSVGRYCLLKETSKTWCVVAEWDTSCYRKHYIRKTSKKKFAYPTIEEAANSFLIRKKRQVKILSEQLDRARLSLEMAKVEYQRVLMEKT